MYTFIAYKPDTCNFISSNHLNAEQLAKEWAEVKLMDLQRYYGEDAKYSVEIYESGDQVWDEYGATFDGLGESEDVIKQILTIEATARTMAESLLAEARRRTKQETTKSFRRTKKTI